MSRLKRTGKSNRKMDTCSLSDCITLIQGLLLSDEDRTRSISIFTVSLYPSRCTESWPTDLQVRRRIRGLQMDAYFCMAVRDRIGILAMDVDYRMSPGKFVGLAPIPKRKLTSRSEHAFFKGHDDAMRLFAG